MLSFKPIFKLSSFTFIKRLFSSSSLSAIRVVSSVYPRLLIFLPAILIPACGSSSPAFLVMDSAYKLSKQGDNIHTALMYSFSYLEPVCCSMSSSKCCFLTCIQLPQEAGQVNPFQNEEAAGLVYNMPSLCSVQWVCLYFMCLPFSHLESCSHF